MTYLAYVDLSNLFIEGQKVSALAKGLARSLTDVKLTVLFHRVWKGQEFDAAEVGMGSYMNALGRDLSP